MLVHHRKLFIAATQPRHFAYAVRYDLNAPEVILTLEISRRVRSIF